MVVLLLLIVSLLTWGCVIKFNVKIKTYEVFWLINIDTLCAVLSILPVGKTVVK